MILKQNTLTITNIDVDFSDFLGAFLQKITIFNRYLSEPSGARVESGKVAENIMVCRWSLPWAYEMTKGIS
jgi:hypothetical protein